MSNENMNIWNKTCAPPAWALRQIQAGRMRGKTDINPQWRMKVLTEIFGPAGVGWTYTIDRLWTENGANDEVFAFALVSLKVKFNEGWSDSIPGIGGDMLVKKEKNGLYNDDDCYKKAVTDALSVAAKALGIGADIYQGEQWSKYKHQHEDQPQEQEQPQHQQPSKIITESQHRMLEAKIADKKLDREEVRKWFALRYTNGEKVSLNQVSQEYLQKFLEVVDDWAALEFFIKDKEVDRDRVIAFVREKTNGKIQHLADLPSTWGDRLLDIINDWACFKSGDME